MALLKFTAVLFCCILQWGNALGWFGKGSLGNPLKMTLSDLKNCTPGDSLVLKKLSLPDTIHVPGPVPVSLTGELKEPLSGPLSIAVDLKKKILGSLVNVPCINNVGSCVYDYICEKLNHIAPGGLCTLEMLIFGDLCHCPIIPSVLHIPSTVLHIPQLKLPSVLTPGEFHLKVTANSGEKTIGCLHTSVTLT